MADRATTNPRPNPEPKPVPTPHLTVSPAGHPRTRATRPIIRLLQCCIAEIVGAYLMVTIGTGVVAAAVLSGAQVGLWQVAVVWWIGVTLAIYVTAAISGAHLNPAVSLAFAIFRRDEFPFSRIPAYWASQLTGSALAGLTVLTFYGRLIARFESENGLVRGGPGSQHSGMLFGEYFPNPAIIGTDESARALVSAPMAALVEGVGAAVLVLVIFALVDRRNGSRPVNFLSPVLIGATVAAIISVFAPLTMGGWNPARDFGPRLVAFFAGWGEIAIPGPSSGFWAYIVGPLIGGPVGAALYDILLRPAFRGTPSSQETTGVPVEPG